jgi:hypothetical protein
VRIPSRRLYASHRRAWTPRLWPILLADVPLILALNFWIQPSVLGAAALGVGVALLSAQARWTIWRRRHPVIPLDEYVTDLLNEMRRKARWN